MIQVLVERQHIGVVQVVGVILVGGVEGVGVVQTPAAQEIKDALVILFKPATVTGVVGQMEQPVIIRPTNVRFRTGQRHVFKQSIRDVMGPRVHTYLVEATLMHVQTLAPQQKMHRNVHIWDVITGNVSIKPPVIYRMTVPLGGIVNTMPA